MPLVPIEIPRDIWPTREWSGKVVAVHVEQGDCVEKGTVIAEVEVEKAVLEVTSPVAGKVVEVKTAVGDVVGPGSIIALVEEGSCR